MKTMTVRRSVEMVQTVEINDETSQPINLIAIAKAFTDDENWEIINEKIQVSEKKETGEFDQHAWLNDVK